MASVHKTRKLKDPHMTSGPKINSVPGANGAKGARDTCSESTPAMVAGRGSTMDAVRKPRPGLNHMAAPFVPSYLQDRHEADIRGLTPTQASASRRVNMARDPNLGRPGTLEAQVQQLSIRPMSRPRPASRTVSRPSVNILSLQLEHVVPQARARSGQNSTTVPRSGMNRPQTYAELFRNNPMDPTAQDIVNEMSQIAECHRLHLQMSCALETLSPDTRLDYENIMKSLERTMRKRQDHIRELERAAGLIKTPRVI